MKHERPEAFEPSLHSLLAAYREAARNERDKGTYFERFAVAYLSNDPLQRINCLIVPPDTSKVAVARDVVDNCRNIKAFRLN